MQTAEATDTVRQKLLIQLREKVGHLTPSSPNSTKRVKSYTPRDLLEAKFVFIRVDSHHKPLQPPYTGPYQVFETNDKVFKVQVGNRIESMSIIRLKPAHLDHEEPVEVAQPPTRGRPKKQAKEKNVTRTEPLILQNNERSSKPMLTSHSGRAIKFPQRFTYV